MRELHRGLARGIVIGEVAIRHATAAHIIGVDPVELEPAAGSVQLAHGDLGRATSVVHHHDPFAREIRRPPEEGERSLDIAGDDLRKQSADAQLGKQLERVRCVARSARERAAHAFGA